MKVSLHLRDKDEMPSELSQLTWKSHQYLYFKTSSPWCTDAHTVARTYTPTRTRTPTLIQAHAHTHTHTHFPAPSASHRKAWNRSKSTFTIFQEDGNNIFNDIFFGRLSERRFNETFGDFKRFFLRNVNAT